MKPAPFAYVRPDSLEEALAVLAEHDGDAVPLAGGQSLVPAMNFRVAQPAMLVDLNRVPGLDGVEQTPDGVRIGAMTRHVALERSPIVADRAPLIPETMPFVAHAAIRTRGTLGGSLAHADPAAELPALMLALDATLMLASGRGTRSIPADAFFTGLYQTMKAPDELITAVSIPSGPPGAGWAFEEVARRHGDYALAGAAAVVALDATGLVSHVRLALLSVHDRPVLATEAGRVLRGQPATPDAIAAAADAAMRDDVDPASDIHASSAYRRHLVGVLARRVLTRAIERARHHG